MKYKEWGDAVGLFGDDGSLISRMTVEAAVERWRWLGQRVLAMENTDRLGVRGIDEMSNLNRDRRDLGAVLRGLGQLAGEG